MPDGGRPKTLYTLDLVTAQVLLILGVLLTALGFPNRDFSVPLRLNNDSLQYQVISQTTAETGWWWRSDPRLSAPFGFRAVAYPVNGNVDQTIVWAVSRFSSRPGLTMNVAWFVMVVLAGLLATGVLRLLGASKVSAFVFGTLYAFLPYSLYRNIDFFHIVTWLLPLPSAAALAVTSHRVPETRAHRAGFVAGCALVGFNYIYNAFFSGFVLLIALIFCGKPRTRPLITFAAGCFLVVCTCAMVNLVPTYVVWAREGKPVTMFFKRPAEAETLGLKIRHLVSPLPDHTFPPFRAMNVRENEARFPLEGEAMTARLGVVPSLGFLVLIAVLLQPQLVKDLAHARVIAGAAQLNIACVLLGTIGGFGSLFNLLVAPDIRGYNRITPFIGFFSLAGLAFLLDSVVHVSRPLSRFATGAIATLVLAVGLWDQCHALRPFANSYPAVASEYDKVKRIVSDIERALPADALVYQLPFSYFLGDDGVGRMGPYDQARPYLVSKNLRWSFPAMSNVSTFWGHRIARLPPRDLVAAVRAAGFSALLIDRLGYDDNGERLVNETAAALGTTAQLASDGRYVVFDLRSVRPTGAPSLDALTADPRMRAATAGLGACSVKGAMTAVDWIGSRFGGGQEIALSSSRAFEIRGWAMWHTSETEAQDVDVAIDGVPLGTYYGLDRGDVARAYKRSAYRLTGFLTEVPAGKLSKGPHTLAPRVVAPDGRCYDEGPLIHFETR